MPPVRKTVRLSRALALSTAVALMLPGRAPAQTQRSIARADMDTTCPACRDFATYANGSWVKRTTIPAEYPLWDGFTEAFENSLAALHRVLDAASAAAATTKDADERKVGTFYATCMDSAADDRAGLAPLRPLLDSIDAARTPADIMRSIVALHRLGISAGFVMSSEVDPKASDWMIGQLYQGGLGLPDREYYTKTDPQSDTLKRAYVEHVRRTLMLAGMPASAAQNAADRVMRLETALAVASMTIVEQRDPQAVYHKMTVRALSGLAPHVDWAVYLRAVGAPSIAGPADSLDVSQPKFYAAFDSMLAHTPVDDWRVYLRWQLLNATSTVLDSKFFIEAFSFRKTLSGVKEPQPRWKRCAQWADNGLGEALGQLYVRREFSPAAKARMIELVGNLQAVFQERIKALDWMTPATKEAALVKLAAFGKKIAYPDKWRDYSALTVRTNAPFVVNWNAANAFETKRQLDKIGKPKDRTEWGMTPPTVNAYYTPVYNEIVFPAGILQAPFFFPDAEDAVNYGAIGMVIGHEMTHGFDDQGRQYDAKGNLRDWWTADDAKAFTERANKVVEEYDSFVPVDTLHINGKQTLGENLADIGGLTLAYYAYERSLAGKPRPPVIGGLTPEQRFFIGGAQAWHFIGRTEYLRLEVATDVHSPDPWRVNGAVSAMPEFAAAFGCKSGDAMVRADVAKARIW